MLTVVPIPSDSGVDGYNQFMSVYVVPVVSQLTLTIADATVWKPLNHAVRCSATARDLPMCVCACTHPSS